MTNFEKFLIHSQSTGLFLVLDEAHHAPAYGCRNLLIGGTKFIDGGIRQFVPNSNFLGLTATPTYSDKNKSGWLLGADKIFSSIIYEAQKTNLQEKGILAHEKYYEVQTGEVFDLSDKDYEAVVRDHRDLPENIVTKMAESQQRNNLIVEEYVTKRELFGKTIIFADRWFQCVDLKEKLLKRGVLADAIYSHIDSSFSNVAERNKRTSTENSEILEQFKKGDLDILINVKMLTEGTDVPDVDTVFITRQTTSKILLTQMIGRALRGTASQKNGKIKDIANIVFFEDTWRRLINFAQVGEGGTEESEPKTRGRYPIEWITIHLIEELSRKLDNGSLYSDNAYLSLLPIGWYETEISVSTEGDLERYKEFIVVLETAKPKFENLIAAKLESDLTEWEDENLSDDFIKSQGISVMNTFFGNEDNTSRTLDFDVVRIMRHLAQNGKPPEFVYFEQRNSHDLAELAKVLLSENQFTIHDKLEQEYNNTNRLWNKFYRDFNRFKSAFDSEINKAFQIHKFGQVQILNVSAPIIAEKEREPSEEVKGRVLKRDNYTCQCCGYEYNGRVRSRKLEVDHIVSYHFGGDNTENNLQCLCSVCNKDKNINSINFLIHNTPMSVPKGFSLPIPKSIPSSDYYENSLQRIINSFYHCKAICQINTVNNGKIKYSSIWEIELYSDNPIEWIIDNKQTIIDFVHKSLGYNKLKDILIS